MPIINTTKEKFYNREYNDLMTMLGDIKKHIKKYGKDNIIMCDEPKKLLLGYICTKTSAQWNISLSSLRNSNGNSHSLFIYSYFNTLDGRKNIIEDLEKLI